MLVDTHCHIHEASYQNAEDAFQRARTAGVTQILCVGTDQHTSVEAKVFAESHENTWYSVGVHPHDAKGSYEKIGMLSKESSNKLVAIGEIGLDYFYTHSPREVQIQALETQLQWAREANLPIIFHVREAFDDFWPIFHNFSGIRGVLHSFTDTEANLEIALNNSLYIGVNGISTFTKDDTQKQMYDQIPLEKLLLETDAPYLTPTPHRGKVNEPAFVRHVAEYHAQRRGVELEHLARVTSANASTLFSI